MNYPTISEYVESIMLAEDNFDQLSSLRPVLDFYGNPVMSSGNFAVVFKMKDIDTGKFYAVKCFIKDQKGRNESYAMIADEIKNVSSPYIVPIRFLERELFVDSSQSDETEFPVLVMDWVEGKTLDAYLRENLEKKYSLQLLTYRFCQMSAWLMEQPFAHGDLKPDNILVREDGSLVLVDYDGFYVPAMKGQEARELGSPDFRHPQRTAQDFDEHIDDFSIATIALSLKAISLDSQLYNTHAASDRLLLSAIDYHDIGNSKTMQKIVQLASNTELATLLSVFYMASALKMLDKTHSKMFEIEMPAVVIGEGKEILTRKDVKQAEKEYGELTSILISNSVTSIGNWAFRSCKGLTSVTIGNSVTSIGDSAFDGCKGLTSVTIGNSVTSIGDRAFNGCTGLTSIIIPNFVTEIGSTPFVNCSGLTSIVVEGGNIRYDSRDNCNAIIETSTNTLIAGCKNTIIPNSVTSIGDRAFIGCTGLTSIIIPNSVISIGDSAFWRCSGLISVTIPNSVTSIGDSAFYECTGLISVTIPNSVTSIGDSAFYECTGLTEVTIPNSVTSIGNWAFNGCTGLTSIIIPNSVTSIGKYAFSATAWYNNQADGVIYINNVLYKYKGTMPEGTSISIKDGTVSITPSAFSFCRGLTSVTIPNSVTSIGDRAFMGCTGLTSIIIPNSVTLIGTDTFYECTGLTEVNYNAEICTIMWSSFRGCSNLKTLNIGNDVKIIPSSAFYDCIGLTSVTISNSVTSIGKYAFYECTVLTEVELSDSIEKVGCSAFERCMSLSKIMIPKGARQKFMEMLDTELHSKLVEQ